VPPQSLSVISGSPRASPRPAQLSCGSLCPRRLPGGLSPYWFGEPTSWFIHRVVLTRRVPEARTSWHAFLGLPLHSRVIPESPGCRPPASPALTRFPPPRRNPKATSHHPRNFHIRVTLRPCRSRRLRRLPPVAISPVCFNRARPRGSSLSEPSRTAIAGPLDPRLPSCDLGECDRHQDPEVPGHPPGHRPFRLSASGPDEPQRTRRRNPTIQGSANPTAPRNGVPRCPRFKGLFPLPVGSPPPCLHGPRRPSCSPRRSLLPGAFPFPASAFPGAATALRPSARALASPPGSSPRAPPLSPGCRGSPASASSPVLQRRALPGSFPCTTEFQRTGKSAGLFRGCRPLRGFPPRPASSPVARFPRRVSERPSDPISKSKVESDTGPEKCQSPPDRPFWFPSDPRGLPRAWFSGPFPRQVFDSLGTGLRRGRTPDESPRTGIAAARMPLDRREHGIGTEDEACKAP